MEEMIKVIVEQGLVAGSFIVMLYFFLAKFSKSQDEFSKSQNLIASTLIEISKNMEKMEERLTRLEERKNKE